MPEWEILELENLPDAVLFDVLILIDAAFPPLHEASGVRVFDAFVSAGGHEGSETPVGTVTRGSYGDHVLHLGVVEKEAVDWSISAIDEPLRETVDIQPLDTCFAAVSAADEFHESIGMISKEIDYLGWESVMNL